DRTLLQPAGQAIMGGFHASLVDGFGAVRQFIGGIGGEIADAAGGSLGGTIGVAGAGGGLGGASAGGVRQVVEVRFVADGTTASAALLEILREAVRVQGGDVQAVFAS